MITPEHQKALDKIKELESILDLKNDEYVQQVGTWKIIQRLEQQVKELEDKITMLESVAGANFMKPEIERLEKENEILAIKLKKIIAGYSSVSKNLNEALEDKIKFGIIVAITKKI